jgi:NH3-dependent NAD+ synthetase
VHDRNLCEVFSIGLTILEAGSLKDCTEVYGFTSDYRYTETKIKSFLDIFENRYSQEFTYLITEMLQTNPKQRIRAQTVYERLKPYEESIVNL